MTTFASVRNAYWKACLLTALGILGLVIGSGKAQAQQALFPVATQISSGGSYPDFTGDFNGDGVPDLAFTIAGNTEYSVSILLSIGSNAPTTVTTSLCPNTGGTRFRRSTLPM